MPFMPPQPLLLTRRSALRLGALGVTLAAAGCATPPPPPPPTLSYTYMGQIHLKVSAVQVVNEYQPPPGGNDVSNQFPVPPAEAVRIWATDRLRAEGGDGTVQVIIKDASVVATNLQPTGGITGTFTVDQDRRYDARLVVDVVGNSPATNNFHGYTSATVTRSTTTREDLSLAARQQIWLDMTDQMIRDLNAQLDPGIRRDLAPIVAY